MAGTFVLALIRSRQSSASPKFQNVSPMKKSTPSWASICSSSMPATSDRADGLSGAHFQVALRSPATSARSPAASRARRVAIWLISKVRSAWPTVASFSRLP